MRQAVDGKHTGARVALFVAGGQKCGTSSLHDYLARHPQLCAGPVKELHFFDDEGIDWDRPNYHRLEAGFDGAGGRICFDATPIYGFWPGAVERIGHYNPAARLIFLFRDPVARAWSQWCMEYARGHETMPFATAIREGRQRMRDGPDAEAGLRHYSYIERGAYGMQVARALARFPRRQLLFLESAELDSDHQAVLGRIADFLGLDPFPPMPAVRRNVRPDRDYPIWPDAADRDYIMARLARDRVLFERLTRISTATWGAEIMRD